MRLSLAFFALALSQIVASEPIVGGASADLTAFVDPMIGTGGSGHTYPGAVYPFGMVQLSPDTEVKGWTNTSGYHYQDQTIIGFSHAHLSGTGVGDFGDILFQPITGDVKWHPGDAKVSRSGYRSAFSHADEKASPGYYQVLLKDYNVNVELTATAHAGMHRYTFPDSVPAHILIDLAHGLDNKTLDASLVVEGPRTISGYRRSKGWAKDKTFYFVAEFSQPFSDSVLRKDEQILSGAKEAKGVSVQASLDFDTSKGKQVLVRVGLSPTSIDEARKNLAAEMANFDFDAVAASTRKVWNDQLSTIEISTKDPSVRKIFYTALYHTMLSPHLYNNVDGSYPGPDKKVHRASFQNYSTFSVWDQFRAWFPLMTVVEPGRVDDMVNSLLAFYYQADQSALPVWNLAGNETWCMIGYNSVVQVATAYRAGFRGFDGPRVLEAMKASALHPRFGQDQFHEVGYLQADKPATKKKWASVSRTLEFSYDDFSIGMMAKALGQKDDADKFLKYAMNYQNVFDPETKFMRGKNSDGAFVTPFRPDEYYRNDYTEASAWQYTFTVPHDQQGLINLMGGDEAFSQHLENLFLANPEVIKAAHDISGFIGQYAQGNEPVHGYAYMFAYAGQPWRGAPWLRKIMNLYHDGPDGLCGNDDCGQMSAWYIFGALGFYPVDPVRGEYVLGTPLVDHAVINLDPKFYPGKKFILNVENNSAENIYIQSADLNGKPLDRSYLTHEDLTRGSTLKLVMGPTPNKEWGRLPEARPSSLTPHPDKR